LLPSATLLLVDAYPGMAERAPAWGYRAPTEARLALQSITACDGAGRFDPQASFVLRNDRTKDLMGFVLACRMGLDVGHIAQLAVAPGLQRQGVGRALLVRALDTLKDLGCQTTHLAVHRDNVGAYALYRALGFRECHSFPEFRLERSDARLA
jgi:ribosomal protein S18 acetylase RimI-like enzyme